MEYKWREKQETFYKPPITPHIPFLFQAGADYVAINATFLGSTTDRQCVTVQTLEDTLVEDGETLAISATTDGNLPVSFSNTAEVTIVDNEGKAN